MNTYTAAFNAAIQHLWTNIAGALPGFVVALVVFSLGLLIAGALGRVAKKVIQVLKIDVAVEKAAEIVRLQTLGWKLKFADLVGWVVQWFFVVVVFIAVADILHLTQITDFLRQVAMYIPNVLVAIIVIGLSQLIQTFFAAGSNERFGHHHLLDRAHRSQQRNRQNSGASFHSL